MFTWDERKRRENLRKHGVDFACLEGVFQGYTLTAEDTREWYGERRFLTLGLLHDVVVSIAHTERMDCIRVISARRATKDETNRYFESLSG